MKHIIISISIVLLLWLQAWAVSNLKNGFVTWSEGDKDERTLYLRTITNGELGPVKKIVEKGEAGGDIEGVISFDGKWIAFTRKREATCMRVGSQNKICEFVEDDFNKFHCWSIYVARLDGTLPTTPVKVADEGYSPSWSDNSTGSDKTLFFSVWTLGEIWKAVINDEDNKVSAPVKHASIPGWTFGNHHMQCAPNGKLAGVRLRSDTKVIGLNGFDHDVVIGRGENFSWFADSYWLYIARGPKNSGNGWIGNINKESAEAFGAGCYHFGSAANMKWAITVTKYRVSSVRRNNGFKLQYAEVTKTGDSLIVGKFLSPLISEKGSWPDIHDFEDTVPFQSHFETPHLENFNIEPPLPEKFIIEQIDQRLFVNTAFPVIHTVELYDVKGVRKAVSIQSHSSRAVLSVKGFPAGLYVLRIKLKRQSIRKILMLH